jgi:hypothetical protein
MIVTENVHLAMVVGDSGDLPRPCVRRAIPTGNFQHKFPRDSPTKERKL